MQYANIAILPGYQGTALTTIITAASIKGGVGKTTTIALLGHYAASRGLRTLLVDLDVQASLSASFYPDIDDIPQTNTVYHLITTNTAEPITPHRIDKNLYLLPANPDLNRLTESRDLTVFASLKDHLPRVSDAYDLILIDTPGSTNSLLAMALAATDHVYAPIELARYSIAAFHHIMQLILTVQRTLNPSLNFLGFLPNRVHRIRYQNGTPTPYVTRQREIYDQLSSMAPDNILGLFGQRNAIRDIEDGVALNAQRRNTARIAQSEADAFATTLFTRTGLITPH